MRNGDERFFLGIFRDCGAYVFYTVDLYRRVMLALRYSRPKTVVLRPGMPAEVHRRFGPLVSVRGQVKD